MVDQLITFETAKLAKEKGFDVHSSHGLGVSIYTKDGKTEHTCYTNGSEILKPSQSLLHRWLREKHKQQPIVITTATNNGNIGYVYSVKGIRYELFNWTIYETWELAMEAALVESLNLINNG